MQRSLVPLVIAVSTYFAVAPATAEPSAQASSAARADVNGDGIADLVMSTGARLTYSGDTALVPHDLGGSVQVVPGGLTLPAALVNQNSPGVGLGMEAGDRFGTALATADFNGDGLADVAIGNPGESVNGLANAGTVSVLYGQRTAPYLRTIAGALGTITQDTANVPGAMEAGDLFGASLAAGDFNGDGYADLGIGSPGEAIETKARAGAVWIFHGGSAGLTSTGAIAFNQDHADLAGAAEAGDLMGFALAAGDVTGDKRDDLAVLSAGEVISGTTGATGAVHLLHGSASGVNPVGSYVSVGAAATGGKWRSLVVGKFHGGANADLVIQADQRRGGPAGSGALVAVRGSGTGLTTAGIQVIDQDTATVPGGTEPNDFFGGSLAVGDLDGDSFDDLAAGSIKENTRAGSVFLFRGSATGLLTHPPSAFGENAAPINGNEQPGEGFGYGLRVLDVTGDGKPELVVAAPWEDGSLQTGALFLLTTGLSGDSLAVTGSRRVTRADISTPSGFGPGAPIAGSAHVLNDNLDSPR
ncbi:FG-GAP-like repeat-containing protein [Kibdelosporangium phytohabitans]|uniref:FG-GAP-like repeat-containing protein n=1 Tax=Kibdelosporangium phytohabitans TaxID=860235 RepID=UPI000A59F6E1|nr:FG-GAP-like repeat-containing protein [Kibdelosporangium phytohabitans]